MRKHDEAQNDQITNGQRHLINSIDQVEPSNLFDATMFGLQKSMTDYLRDPNKPDPELLINYWVLTLPVLESLHRLAIEARH